VARIEPGHGRRREAFPRTPVNQRTASGLEDPDLDLGLAVEGERVWYRVVGFKDLQTVNGLKPYAKIAKEGDPSAESGLYPVNALVFETAAGELVK
jgi:hypothetical protein